MGHLEVKAGFSLCKFSQESNVLSADGWVVGNCDSVELFDNSGSAIGQAQLNVPRPDVVKAFPQYETSLPGWTFSEKISGNLSNIKDVKAVVRFGEKQISITKQCEFLPVVPGKAKPNLIRARLIDACNRMKSFVEIDEDVLRKGWSEVETGGQANQLLLDIAVVDEHVHFKSGVVRIRDMKSARTLLLELLSRQDYAFDAGKEDPFIIDAGAHCGMSLAYFKSIYPNSKILAFEPEPKNFSLLVDCVQKNQWSSVDIQNFALAAYDGSAELQTTADDSMGATLSDRLNQKGLKTENISVGVRRLGTWIDRPVDLLKLDIEGAEFDVLEDIAPKLSFVKRIVCEVHVDATTLVKVGPIFSLLVDAGFYVNVSRSVAYSQNEADSSPFDQINSPYSLIIWAAKM